MTNTRTALITGASRGLGHALARELARQGWNLIIDARDAATLNPVAAELAGMTQVAAINGDITDARHRESLARAASELGGLDAMINNAGMLGPSPQPNLLDYPLDTLLDVFRTNVVAQLGVIQAAQAALKPGARIVNITSDASVEAYAGWGGYGASKSALDHLSRILAAERPDLRVYAVDPGDMRTDMQQAAYPGEDISDRQLPETSVPGIVALLDGDYPSGRYQARTLLENTSRGAIELRVALTVADFDRTLALYRDGLGLPVANQWSGHGGRGILLNAGRATLELLETAHAEYVDRVEVGERVAGPVRLAFEVADLDAAAGGMTTQGATVVGGPITTPWGHRNVRLRAPDDLQITLFHATSDAEVPA